MEATINAMSPQELAEACARAMWNGDNASRHHSDSNSDATITQTGSTDVAVVFQGGPGDLLSSEARTVLEHHITPREVGRVFAQIRPKAAILTHLVLKAPDAPSIEELLEEVGQEYDQPVTVARDLTIIRFGASIAIYSGKTARG